VDVVILLRLLIEASDNKRYRLEFLPSIWGVILEQLRNPS
jgi:hypothetical protein